MSSRKAKSNIQIDKSKLLENNDARLPHTRLKKIHKIKVVSASGVFTGTITIECRDNKFFLVNSKCEQENVDFEYIVKQADNEKSFFYCEVDIIINGLRMYGLAIPIRNVRYYESMYFNRFIKPINGLIGLDKYIELEKALVSIHSNNNDEELEYGGNEEPGEWFFGLLFPCVQDKRSVGNCIIENIESIDRIISNRFPLFIAGLDSEGRFDVNAFCEFNKCVSAVSKYRWSGETELVLFKYSYIRQTNSKSRYKEKPKILINFSKCFIYKFDSILNKRDKYQTYMSILLSLDRFFIESKTSKDIIRKIEGERLLYKTGIITCALIKKFICVDIREIFNIF